MCCSLDVPLARQAGGQNMIKVGKIPLTTKIVPRPVLIHDNSAALGNIKLNEFCAIEYFHAFEYFHVENLHTCYVLHILNPIFFCWMK